MGLIPNVKKLLPGEGYLLNKKLRPIYEGEDCRLKKALEKLPLDHEGTKLELCAGPGTDENYSLTVTPEKIEIRSMGAAGAFYGIQTLRQLLEEERVPCLEIYDCPDFEYRGFYHDVTRGRIATVDRIRKLIDDMARFKLNSLQLYVEHVFEFQETEELRGSTGCYTKAELREIDDYCRENFIDFVPSLATFGHMNDILNQPCYRHLRVLKDYEPARNFWRDRMAHHTIDPREQESITMVQSLINQYAPCFRSEWFNICCDETFDLKHCVQDRSENGKMYVEFVKKIIAHTQLMGKKPMMWADILLEHPETIEELPKDTMFLNWYYDVDSSVMEQMISTLADLGCTQIVCPGTSSWNRFCERYEFEVPNILGMIRCGHRHGVKGVLNTNWGDWGNLCSLDLGMYGMVLGAAASWNVGTENDDEFHDAVNNLLYGSDNGVEVLQSVSAMQDKCDWQVFLRPYFGEEPVPISPEVRKSVQDAYRELYDILNGVEWGRDEYRQAFLLAIEGICAMVEHGMPTEYRLTDPEAFLKRYRTSWIQSSKESELRNIEAVFRS